MKKILKLITYLIIFLYFIVFHYCGVVELSSGDFPTGISRPEVQEKERLKRSRTMIKKMVYRIGQIYRDYLNRKITN